MKKIIVLALLTFSISFSAQNLRKDVKNSVETFFSAMRNADAVALQNTLAKNAVFQTVTNDGTVKTEDPEKFAESISKFSKGDLDEQIRIKKIRTDGQLASVWMDYRFVFKGKESHCGANSFQLVQQDGKWLVQQIIDTRRSCSK